MQIAAPSVCPDCGTQLAPAMLACPSCQRLVHAARLRELSTLAEHSAEPAQALSAWRDMLDLLPPGSRQHSIISSKVVELSRQVDSDPAHRRAVQGNASTNPDHAQRQSMPAALAGLGAVGLLLWKFKFLLGFILTKGKLLLMGLTQSSTLFSMLLSAGVYWTVWGWKFAVGLVLSIYIHEMGHVAMLHRYGFKASAPTFIPGLGALIRLKQHPAEPREDARIGLAGPMWGLGASLACVALWFATGNAIFGAIAEVGAWINLFNLAPIGSLDGGRGFRALSRRQRWIVTMAMASAWFFTHESLLVLLMIVAILRTLADRGDERGDVPATVHYVMLVAALSALCLLKVKVNGLNV